MLSTYADVLRIPGAWRFSASGLVMRMPMSLVGISTILAVQAEYGSYSLAGVVSGVYIIASCICAPLLARFVDTHGQRRIMAPAVAVSASAMAGLAVAITAHAPAWILCVLAGIAGATWGSPGSLVRSRWSQVVRSPKQLTTAYALEAALDEFCFIVGPILATVLGTVLHPVTGLVVAFLLFAGGTFGFLSQTATEPPARPRLHGDVRPAVLRNPVIIVLALTYVGAGTMFGANDVSVVAFTQEHGAPGLAGVLLAFFAAGSFTAALVYGSRTWSRPLWQLFAGGILLLALGVSTFLLARDLLTLGIVMWVTGLTIAPTMTNVNTIVARVVSPSQLTEGLTVTITAMNVGASLGSALGGRAIDAGGAHAGFLVVVTSAWLMVLLMLIGLPRLRRDTLRAGDGPSTNGHDGSPDKPSTGGHSGAGGATTGEGDFPAAHNGDTAAGPEEGAPSAPAT